WRDPCGTWLPRIDGTAVWLGDAGAGAGGHRLLGSRRRGAVHYIETQRRFALDWLEHRVGVAGMQPAELVSACHTRPRSQ
ncbi:MAG: hypothetical protein ACKOJF_24915, partial [Planctomycetaceae bacterium]